VLDCGVFSPVVVFLEGFKEEGVPITIDEARQPMGTHKKVHLRKITEIPTVRERWCADAAEWLILSYS
jgi:phosphonoacetaldehyde hydrolase